MSCYTGWVKKVGLSLIIINFVNSQPTFIIFGTYTVEITNWMILYS